MVKKNKDITHVLGKQQRKLLKDLRTQVDDLQGVLKLLAAGQNVDTVRREHMEFLGTVGSRTLNSKELAMAKEGIPLDELRKICGRKMLASEGSVSLRDSIPHSHILKMIYAEHDLMLYYISTLESLNTAVQQIKRWTDDKNLLNKISHTVAKICGMDAHQLKEERILFPKLAAHGCDDLLQDACADHDRIHKSRVELKMLSDSIGKMAFHQWKERFDEVAGSFIPAAREHIYKEQNLLYPTALRVITEPRVWESIKAVCDEAI